MKIHLDEGRRSFEIKFKMEQVGKRKRENHGTISMKKEARGCAITRRASA